MLCSSAMAMWMVSWIAWSWPRELPPERFEVCYLETVPRAISCQPERNNDASPLRLSLAIVMAYLRIGYRPHGTTPGLGGTDSQFPGTPFLARARHVSEYPTSQVLEKLTAKLGHAQR